MSATQPAAAAEPAIPLTRVVEPADPVRPGASSSAPASHHLPATQAAPSRTLEDAVAEMLRPMLQQWVSDNMPRIIEKALRNEASQPAKPGSTSKS